MTLDVKRDVRFKGKVRSPASDCAVGRKVLLYRRQPGRDKKIAKAYTSVTRRYSVSAPNQRGNRVYALVKRFRTPLDTICQRDRSPVVKV